jgi:hypothetical protein
VPDEEPGSLTREGFEDLRRVFQGAGYRLLQDDVLAVPGRLYSEVPVE